MKRILHSILALCALGLSSPAWAQSDVTSTYLPGGSFENCTAATASASASGTAATTGVTNGEWTYATSSPWSCSAVVAYGQSDVLVNGVAAPSADNAGNAGQALGVSVGWYNSSQPTSTGTEIWTSTDAVTLPAGTYSLKYYAYNNNSASQFASKVGFVATDGTEYLSSKTSFASGAWEEDEVEIILDKATEGKFQVGGRAVSGGSGANGKVFFDNLTLTYTEKVPELAVVAEGDYYLYNTASGKYLCAGNSWGTYASINSDGLDVTLARLSDGKYSIATRLAGSYLGSNLYMDTGTAAHCAFYAVEGAENTYYIAVDNVGYLAYDGASTALVAAAKQSVNAQWVLVAKDELFAQRYDKLAEASKDNPVDATFLIEDANFNRNDDRVAAWTMVASNQNLGGGSTSSNGYSCAESWHSTFALSQTVDLPAGVYGLTAQGFYRQDGTDTDNLPVFFFGDKTVSFPALTSSENSMTDASISFAAGNYTIDPIFLDVEDGGTLLGAKLENNTNLWCIWDNFQLTYYGTETTADVLENAIYFEQLAAAVEEATELLNDTTLADSKKAGLEEAIAAAEEALEGSDITAVKEANAALTEVMEAPKAYKKYGDVLAQMKKLTESTNFYTKEALNDYYTRWQAAYDAGTLTTEEGEALVDPYALTAWHAGAQSMNSFLLDSWNTASANFDGFYINTWSVEGETDGSDFKVPFYEYWTGDAATLGGKTLSAEVYGLENGDYTVSAVVRVRLSNSATGETPSGITMKANKGEAVSVCEGTAYGQLYVDTVEVACTVTDGYLTVRFDVAADNNVSWLAYQQVKYTKVEKPVSNTLVVPIVAEREIGQGYEPTTDVKVYFTDALEFLGIDSISKATVVGVNVTDGSIVENAADYDGWRNLAGDFAFWGDNSAVCVKFIPEDAMFSICDKNNIPATGLDFICKWALQANGKTVVYEINVKFSAPEGSVREVPVSIQREVGMGYSGQTIDLDIASAMEFLGISDINEATVVGINMTDGSYVENAMATYDGWHNASGDFEYWGENAAVCVKFNPALESAQLYDICDMSNANVPAAGESFTCKWGLQANGKIVIYEVTVNFGAAEVKTYDIVKTITVNHSEVAKTAYSGTTETFDVEEVIEALGAESITDCEQFIVNVTDGNFVTNTSDGWRNASGDMAAWGNAGGVCVKINDPASGIIDYIGCFDDTHEAGEVYHAKWAFVYNEKAVVIDVVITFATATGIQSLTNGQSLENATIYTLGGQRVSNISKGGIYIVNGKKVLVK